LGFKIGFVSLGCAKNLSDTETMMGILSENGHEITPDPSNADIIIVNTCGFIDKAKDESIGAILEMAAYKKSGHCKRLIVTGCLAERYNEEVLNEMPEVDAICGTGDFPAICEIINDCMNGKRVALYGHSDAVISDNLPKMQATQFYTAYMKISDGCDNHCTYCIIPKLRGSYKSRKMESLLAEAQKLAESGVKELILIAQDTTRYGIDIYGKPMLASLLNELQKIEGFTFIRIHYCYPEMIDDELIAAMKNNSKVCHYLDIPIQHSSDNVLKRMGRPSSKEKLYALISKLKTEIPDIAIRTSLIVGFPGETASDFNDLCEFMKFAKLDKVGVFTYSKEEGTPAALMPDQIDEDIKQDRYEKLMEIQSAISKEINQNRIGKIYDILAQGYDENNFMYVGRGYFDSVDVDGLTYFAAHDEVAIGSIVPVKILDADEFDLTGEIVE